MEESTRQRRILVVDDHRLSRTVTRRILEAAGFGVFTANNGVEGLEMARDSEYDAFILDVEMPGMDGIELCRRLRGEPGYRHVPILMSTASDDRRMLQRAFAAGCDDFLRKPLEPLVMTARLRGLLEKSEYALQLERVRENLARYVSPRIRQMVEAGVGTEEDAQPVEREVCVLFSDIRGFTALSQKITPAKLFATVSRNLGKQVDAVYRHGGYVDKFAGDGIMAVFDGPRMTGDACGCALEIVEQSRSSASQDGFRMPLGIGIHQGPVVLGNIGSGKHLDYSAIGNTVNLAARLCGDAHSMDIVVSSAVRDALRESPEFHFAHPSRTRVRGLDEEITVFRLERTEPRVRAARRRGCS